MVHRVEDLDGPRTVPGADAEIADDLRFLGLTWDEGYDGGPGRGLYHQSQRSALYEAALSQLAGQGLTFACSCTRRELRASSSAPHGDLGPSYPGTCLRGPAHQGRTLSTRFRMAKGPWPFVDGLYGQVELDVRDDFVVRRADGLYAYQLAVVVDDIAMGVTHVVRGADLLSSTPRQLSLYAALGHPAPAFTHVPLWLNPSGQRLAKRDRAVAIADYRAAGISPARIVGALAASVGLCPPGMEVMPADLLASFRDFCLSPVPTAIAPTALGLPELDASR